MTNHHEQGIGPLPAGGNCDHDREPVYGPFRHGQQQGVTFQALRAAVQEGLTSGKSDKTLNDVWAEAEQRYQAKHG